MRKRRRNLPPLPGTDSAALADAKRIADLNIEGYDDLPKHIREALWELNCPVWQITELLAQGFSWPMILRALQSEAAQRQHELYENTRGMGEAIAKSLRK